MVLMKIIIVISFLLFVISSAIATNFDDPIDSTNSYVPAIYWDSALPIGDFGNDFPFNPILQPQSKSDYELIKKLKSLRPVSKEMFTN